MAKWIALALVIAGIAAIVKAARKDPRASFDDGSFIGVIVLYVIGIVLVIAGLIVFAVILFQRL